MKHLKGFTIIEIAVVIIIISILATLSVASYQGLQGRAAKNTVLSDLQNAGTVVEQYALKHAGEFPDNDYLAANFNNTTDVNLSIVVSSEEESGGQTGPVYSGLTPIQNSVLFHKVCGEVTADGFGTGTNSVGVVEKWIEFCHPQYGPNRWQLQGWGGQSAGVYDVPVTDSFMQNKITTVTYSDSYRPNRGPVERAFWKEFYDRFLAQGGTFPITTFWNPSYVCNAFSCWNLPPKEELPTLPPVTGGGISGPNEITKSYCIVATHEKYPDILYSFSSDNLTPKEGNCDSTATDT